MSNERLEVINKANQCREDLDNLKWYVFGLKFGWLLAKHDDKTIQKYRELLTDDQISIDDDFKELRDQLNEVDRVEFDCVALGLDRVVIEKEKEQLELLIKYLAVKKNLIIQRTDR